MSIDFDSAALQTQHEEDEYDQEDYAREQEVHHTHSRGCVKCLGSFLHQSHGCVLWLCAVVILLTLSWFLDWISGVVKYQSMIGYYTVCIMK